MKERRRLNASPLRYPGGKGALYSRLASLIRSIGLQGKTFVEPYAGGVGSGIALLVTGQVQNLVINDLDPVIAAFWRSIVFENDHLIQMVLNAPLSVDEWEKQKSIVRAGDVEDLKSFGFAVLYLNRTNRSGILNAGPIGGKHQEGEYKIDARFNRAVLAERIRIIGLYADFIDVFNRDGKEIVDQYAANGQSFLYIDPPYFDKSGSLYLHNFCMDDHIHLSELLNHYRDKHWLLTYDDVPQVEELYSSMRRISFDLQYAAYRPKRATEVAVLSDSLPAIEHGWPI